MTSKVDRLIELQQLYDEYIHDMGKFITDKEIIELETIKKQLEENERIVERLREYYKILLEQNNDWDLQLFIEEILGEKVNKK